MAASPEAERAAHVNGCIDKIERAADERHAYDLAAQPVIACACVVCGVGLDGYGVAQRAAHIAQCRRDAASQSRQAGVALPVAVVAQTPVRAPSLARAAFPPAPAPAPLRGPAPAEALLASTPAPAARNALSVLMEASANRRAGSSSRKTAAPSPPPPADAFCALMQGARALAAAPSPAAVAPLGRPPGASRGAAGQGAGRGGRGRGAAGGGGRGRGGGGSGAMFRQSSAPVPECQRIGGTPFVVDAFRQAPPLGSHFFLSHFHADHYAGLSRKWQAGTLYATAQTAALVTLRLGVPRERIVELPWDEALEVCGVRVTAMDANHCPGAALLLFELPGGRAHLHTGDMRWQPWMARHPALARVLAEGRLHTLHLDTTYCDPRYAFPPQDAAIGALVAKACEYAEGRRTLLLFGAYSIGKERAFLAAARALGAKICVPRARLRVYEHALTTLCDVGATFTTDEAATRVRVVPMGHLALAKLRGLVGDGKRWASVVAFRPTGWAHRATPAGGGADDIGLAAPTAPGAPPKPRAAAATPPPPLHVRRHGRVTIVDVAYSEHSSFEELRACVRALRPERCVPTVNAHSRAKVLEMLHALYDE
jgi:DNA cross-link repair 1A protein